MHIDNLCLEGAFKTVLFFYNARPSGEKIILMVLGDIYGASTFNLIPLLDNIIFLIAMVTMIYDICTCLYYSDLGRILVCVEKQ